MIKIPLVCVSSSTTNLASIYGQKYYVGAVGTSTTCQETQEEFYPHMHRAIGTQTSVMAVDTAVAHELTLVPLSCRRGDPGKHCPRQSPSGERVFVEVQVSSGEIPAYH